jgi:predicted ATPase
MQEVRTADLFFVLTGGPGSGKTTLIEALEAAGFARSQEAGRAIIRDQVASGGNALPWGDRAAFADAMLAFELQEYQSAQAHAGPVFFDRALPDIVGYRRLCALPIPEALDRACRAFRYHARVFIAPPWPDIFVQDAERKQTLAEAERTYEAMVAAYTGYGYTLVTLPCASVSERVRFVRSFLPSAE